MQTSARNGLTEILPAPSLIGLPDHFTAWRKNQAEAVLRALDSPKRFVVLGMPTGFGKSLVYMAAGMLDEGRAVVLTSTKGLQNQLNQDFGEVGVNDIRGMNNYECIESGQGVLFKTGQPVSCDEGPCLSGWECGKANDGCYYFDAQRRAKSSHIAVTNYAYWMGVNADRRADNEKPKPPALGLRGRLILDEAHAAVDELGDFLAVEIGFWEIEGVLGAQWPRESALMEEWRQWARTLGMGVESEISDLAAEVKSGHCSRQHLSRLRELRDLGRRLASIGTARGEWVHEQTRDKRGRKVVKFDPVWPGEYAEQSLFVSVPKVILTSATIRPKTLDLLGIKKEDYDFIEYPSSFPVSSRPFIWTPTVRVRHDMDPGHARLWAAKIDAILRARPDRKGVIHTVSYARRDYLLRYSQLRDRFLVHDGARELQDTVARFRDMRGDSGAVLVSPSVGTGFDFTGDQARFQIIGKVPFPDARSLVLKARQERDPDFFAYVAAQNLVQMAGRGVRSADDWCETIIVDDNWQWFSRKYREFFPRWFLDSCQKSNGVPAPIEQKRSSHDTTFR